MTTKYHKLGSRFVTVTLKVNAINGVSISWQKNGGVVKAQGT